MNKTNKSGPGLSRDIIGAIKPIYHDLTKITVLISRCLHGVTQNANLSFNTTIWKRVPKSNFCGMKKLKLAVYDAIAVYNYGRKATLDIFKNLNIIPGFYTNQMCQNVNIKRQNHRTFIRCNKKKKGDKLVIKSRYLVALIYLFYIDSDLFAFVIGCLSTYS